MIGFPFVTDQHYNSIRIENKGFGIAIYVHKFTSDELYTNIMKILSDPSYKRRISLASEIFRSAPQRPAEKASYWIEQVIRFGSDHLQSAGKDLNFFQYFLLDVLAAFLIIGIILMVLLLQAVLWLKNKCSKACHKIKLKMLSRFTYFQVFCGELVLASFLNVCIRTSSIGRIFRLD